MGLMWIYDSRIGENWNMHKEVKNKLKHNYKAIQTWRSTKVEWVYILAFVTPWNMGNKTTCIETW